MSIRIIDDEPEIALTRSAYDALQREWREVSKYTAHPTTFEEFVRSRMRPRQIIGLPVIDPKMLEVGK